MVVVYTCTVEHECTVGQTCTVKQPLLNYVQWNNGVEFPITSNYKFRSGAKGSALVLIKLKSGFHIGFPLKVLFSVLALAHSKFAFGLGHRVGGLAIAYQ